jgi:hypothetical protein
LKCEGGDEMKKLTLSASDFASLLKEGGYGRQSKNIKKQYGLNELPPAVGSDFSDRVISCIGKSSMSIFYHAEERRGMALHASSGKEALVEWVEGDQYTFWFQPYHKGMEELFKDFFALQEEREAVQVEEVKIQKWLIYEDSFEEDEWNELLEEEGVSEEERKTVREFKEKGYGAPNVVTTIFPDRLTSYRDEAFIAGEGYVWLLDPETVEDSFFLGLKKIGVAEYVERLVLQAKEVLSPHTSEVKKFSIKRGMMFHLKGQIPLLVVVAILCVNMQAWEADGWLEIAVMVIFYEFFLGILSLFACLRPRRLFHI